MLESILKKIITADSLIKNITRWVENKREKRACVAIFYNKDENTTNLLCVGEKKNIIMSLAGALTKEDFKSMVMQAALLAAFKHGEDNKQ
ncbi:MAG: hypothetical protein IJR13_07680 [Bacteroidales bacterium]|nr:hypothetical protein [Bacteroidales bacterium]